MTRLALSLAAAFATVASGGCTPRAAARPVVVELFQSQGCSSCPPADANLAKIADRPDVIALSFAVTYWDGIGWKDTFAQPAFTARQWAYAHGFHRANVFTPEVVADGRRDGVGVDPGDFARLVGRPASADGRSSPMLVVSADRAAISAGPAAAEPADVWLVRYDPRTLQVPIRGGENGGRTLPHKNIVRELLRVGRWNGTAETLRLPPATMPGLVTAVLVQTPGGGPILAAEKAAS